MAIALHHRRPAARLTTSASPFPLAVTAIALVAPALDLVGQLQHVAPLQTAALVACALATVVQLVALAYRPRAAWLAAAALATGTSVILRLGGYPEGPALALLGVVALGTGGAFHPARGMPDLVDAEHTPAQRSDVAVDAPAEPLALPRAA